VARADTVWCFNEPLECPQLQSTKQGTGSAGLHERFPSLAVARRGQTWPLSARPFGGATGTHPPGMGSPCHAHLRGQLSWQPLAARPRPGRGLDSTKRVPKLILDNA
jgi:hypothetical protein